MVDALWNSVRNTYDPLKAGSIDGTDEDPHDKAVVRAMNVKYKPNKSVTGNPDSTLFIGRLNPQTTEDTVKQRFSSYGDVAKCRLVRDLVTGFSKCYAFVEYEQARDAWKAYKEADKTGIDGNEILIEFESERKLSGWVPRRLGGGWGGNKKSGQLRFGGRDRPFRKPLFVEHRDSYRSDDRSKSHRDRNAHRSKDDSKYRRRDRR
ncbi:SNRNP35 (predicted) [Pycnogonum litorale]